MGKTTIDGLAVRSSSQQPISRATKRPTSAMDVTAPRKISTRRTTSETSVGRSNRRTATGAATTRARAAMPLVSEDSGFLDPVESFGYSDTENDFTRDTGADWSDLLGELGTTTVNHSDYDVTMGRPRSKQNQPLALGSGLSNEDELDWGEGSKGDYGFSEEPEPEKKPRREIKKKSHQKRVPVGKIVAVVIALLLIGGAGIVYFWGDSLIARLTGGKSGFWSTLSALVSDTIPFEEDANGRTNVLVFGTSGYNMDGEKGDTTHDGAQLTDSIMVVSFDQDTKDVALLSLPRDLKVSMACYAGKINEVFTCNNPDGTNEEAGAKALMKQVGEVLGMEFQYYAHINWGSLVSIVDTLGGITVTFDEDIFDYGWTNAVAKAGEPITIDGEQALGFARARHGTGGGDFTRGNSQQKILEAIVEKVLNNGVGLDEALGLLNILGDNLRTNFSTDNLKAAVAMATGFKVDGIRQVPLVDYENNVYYVQSSNIDGISFVIPSAGVNSYSAIKAYVRQMMSSDPVVREGAEIAVYNGTEVTGLAGTERDKLEANGYIVANIGDAEAGVCEEAFCIYDLSDGSLTGTAAALADRYKTAVKSGEELPMELRSAVDFVVVIGQADEAE